MNTPRIAALLRELADELEAKDALDLEPRRRRPKDLPFESYPVNGLICVVCGTMQRTTPGGPSCANGHGGAEGVRLGETGHAPPSIAEALGTSFFHGGSTDEGVTPVKVPDPTPLVTIEADGRAVIFDGLGERVGHLLDEMDEWIARAGAAERRLKKAEEVVMLARQLTAYSWEDRLEDCEVSDNAKQDSRELRTAVWLYDQEAKS